MLKVINGGFEPVRATKYSACVDLFSAEDIIIRAGETVKVPLGVCIDEDYIKAMFLSIKEEIAFDEYIKFIKSHYLQLEPRSSLRAKGLIAGTRIIDIDDKDEICFILHNPIDRASFGIQNEIYNLQRKGIEANFTENCINEMVRQFLGTIDIESNFIFNINKGDKIAQIMLCEHKSYLLGYESEEANNARNIKLEELKLNYKRTNYECK